MKQIRYIDILRVERRIFTSIDTIAQVSNEPCWEILIESNNSGECHPHPRFENTHFESEEAAFREIEDYIEHSAEWAMRCNKSIEILERDLLS